MHNTDHAWLDLSTNPVDNIPCEMKLAQNIYLYVGLCNLCRYKTLGVPYDLFTSILSLIHGGLTP